MSTEKARRDRRSFGKIRKLPSGRLQASYIGPDGQRHNAPMTFDTRGDADKWISDERAGISRDEWTRPEPRQSAAPTLAEYAPRWVANRAGLTPKTRYEYRKISAGYFETGELAAERIDTLAIATVQRWHAELRTGERRRSAVYALLRTIMGSVVREDHLRVDNPCTIYKAGVAPRPRHKVEPATLDELAVIVHAVRAEYRCAILLAAWGGLRFGEIAELRRRDVKLAAGVVNVKRGVTYTDQGAHHGDPKTEAGMRPVTMPPQVVAELRTHLAAHVGSGRDALLFPAPSGGQLRGDGALHRDFHAARDLAGLPELRFHDLRHTGATYAARAGATVAELMARLGHSTSSMAMRYQHATAERDRAIAAELGHMMSGGDELAARRNRRAS
jgi:integrase